MVFLVSSIRRKILSVSPITCTAHFMNPNKNHHPTSWLLLENFSNLPQNTGFCFQDSVLLLKQLSHAKGSIFGRLLHSLFIKCGIDREVFVQNNLLRFYGDSGEIDSAHLLFDEIPNPNLVSWTSLVSLYVHDGQCQNGLYLFSIMLMSGFKPNEFGFSVALKACRVGHNFVMGRIIHGKILKTGFESHSFCSVSLLGMYAECGDTGSSHKLFNEIPLAERPEASWNILLNTCVATSDVEGAIELFHQMRHAAVSPNCFTYTTLVKLCAEMSDFELGKCIHAQTIKAGLENEVVVGGALVGIYAKLGNLDDACKVFWILKEKDNVVWCALLSGFNHIGQFGDAMKVYLDFLYNGNKPDPFIYASVFSLCSNLEAEVTGTQVHCSFVKSGFILDPFLASALINMYGSFGLISDSYKCFFGAVHKNEICFSAMINSLVLNSDDSKAVELFCGMGEVGILLNQSIISSILRACGNLYMLKEVKSLHSYVIKGLCKSDSKLGIENALVEVYVKCGVLGDAKMVFEEMQIRNEFSWTTLIYGCGALGQFEEALILFSDMLLCPKSEKPSQFTLVAVIQTCTELEALQKGKQVHGYAIKSGFESHSFVGSALIDMYGAFKNKAGNAFLVFLSMKDRDFVSWSSILSTLSQNGYHEQTLKLFSEFHRVHNFQVDESILSSCLAAVAGLAALEIGKCLHSHIIRIGFEIDLHVASSMIDMYSKCGDIKDAYKFFKAFEDHNLVSWTSMIYGYAYHGLGREAVDLFNEVKEYGLEPDAVTFTGVLTACSHAGLVKEGREIFGYMRSKYSSKVMINHYACMVDLLGRAAQLELAEALINEAPFSSKSLLWKTLLGACSKHGNSRVGNRIARMLADIEKGEPSTYVLLSNINASTSMWENSTTFRDKMKGSNIFKKPGCSWIQLASIEAL